MADDEKCYWKNDAGTCLLGELQQEDVLDMLQVNVGARIGIATCDCPAALTYRPFLETVPLSGNDGYPDDQAGRVLNNARGSVTPQLLDLMRTDR